MVKKKLVLHIGTHKTGTSTIQALLGDNRKLLLESGILYPSTDRGPNPKLQKHTSLFLSVCQGAGKFSQEYSLIMREFDQSNCSVMVLSAEGFSSPQFKQRNFHLLKKFSEYFDIKVVCFVRRQDYFMESLWNQNCKNGQQLSHIVDFLKNGKNSQRQLYLNSLNFYSEFCDVRVINFDLAVKDGLEKTFAEISGIPIPTSKRPRNVSPGSSCALTMAAMTKLGLEFNTMSIIEAFKKDKSKFVLGSKLRKKLLDEMYVHNTRLASGYGIIFSDFLPDEGPDPVLEPDQSHVIAALSNLSMMNAHYSIKAQREKTKKR